ncbi:hypothetical protein [Paludisphaera mucosa]|uniref:Secreted protein n=1 Tax=Paludisphaera mucosa TaxID=3030827 RepID=A0ABT6FIE6_9BACT|nr:hypothetical protein [Paludisphaera mucosa]MDG3007314.1 hypothetical protein [Paludisphaera mucosa]
MLTSLHTIARMSVLAFAGLSLAALTAAQFQPRPATTVATAPNPWEILGAETGPGGSVDLVHREDGRVRRVATPDAERWEYLTPSPWMADDGSMEAVGRFATPIAGDPYDAEGAVGLVRLRLPQAEVLERLELEVMPTGRPAWDPSRDDRVIFPGATGRLYSYRFAPEPADGRNAAGGSSVVALQWRCDPPGGREPFLIDPVWSGLPEMRNRLIVSLTVLRKGVETRLTPSIAPWWLELSDDGEAIVAAGPIFEPSDPVAAEPRVRLRYPSVVHCDGRLQLIFLRHEPAKNRGTVYAADLELAPATGLPRVRPGSALPVGDRPIAFGTLIPSLDAHWAFSFPVGGHQVMSLALGPRPGSAMPKLPPDLQQAAR